jgi:very-short-patch-repair endonuclease
MGWQVIRIWEHEIERDVERSVERVVTALKCTKKS